MKLWHRVCSMLLVLVLIVGLLPTVTPTVVEAAVTDTPAGVRNHLPSTAKDIQYLSDMTWEYSINHSSKEAIKDGAWNNGAAIVLGETTANGGTSFTKGLGVMAISTESDPNTASRTIFDLADNNYAQDYFYAAAGITNRNADALTNGAVFEVWASYDKSVENYADAEFVLLESSGKVSGKNVYQFHLDVSGVRYLKLVVYAVEKINSLNSAWAGACLYNNPGYYPKTDMISSRTKTSNNYDDGTYVAYADRDATFKTQTPTMFNAFESQFNTYRFQNLPEDAVYLATLSNDQTKSAVYNGGKTPSKGEGWVGGTHNTIAMSDGVQKGADMQKDGIKFPANTSLYWNVRKASESSNVTDGYIVYDVSTLNADTFYSIVGATNAAYKWKDYAPSSGDFGGLIFEVWGTYAGSDEFVKLAESEVITKSNTGEFIVDITGVQLLKLRSQSKDTRSHASATGGFMYASVFNQWDISADGATSAVQGTSEQYTATIRKDLDTDYDYTGTVTWSVTGADDECDTKIDANGKLTVDPYETATSLTVTASITEDGTTYSDSVTVAVTKAPVYTLGISGNAEAGKNTEQTITATVTKDGVADTCDGIEWSVSGGSDSATTIDQTGKLTIGNEATDTELEVKAKFTAYGITHVATMKVTVAAYAVTINGNTEMLPGSQTTLNAAITNEGAPVNETVTWSVEGDGTITTSGNQAVVTAANKPGTVKVTATWTTPKGNTCSATQQIAINAYTVDLHSDATIVAQGGSLPLSATVKKNGEQLENAAINWKIINLTTGAVTENTGADMTMTAGTTVGTVYHVTATYEVGGLEITDTSSVMITDCELTVSPSGTVQVTEGETVELTAALTKAGTAVANPAITWTVTNADGSALLTSGASLKILGDAAVGTEMTVVAAATVDGDTLVAEAVKVVVVEKITYKVTLNKTSASVKPGESFTFTAAVSANDTIVNNAEVTWTLTGGTQSGTKLENGVLTIDAAEATNTTLTVTATYAAANVSASATVTVAETPKQEAYTAVTNSTYQTMPGNAIYLADDGVVWIESVNLNNKEAIRNGQWQNGAAIYLGGTSTTGGINFQKGIGVQPQAPTDSNNRGASWTTIDISTYDVDTFYAAIGCTNPTNLTQGINSFIYQVLGATEKDGAFTLLAESDPITKTQTGEFKVDITGYKYLKLLIKCTQTGTHNCGNSMWANACVYNSKVENYVVTATASATTVQQGKSVTFSAAVTKDGAAVSDSVITWAVSGNTASGTTIDSTGKLTVDKAEPADTKLNVTASITVGETTYTSTVVTVTVEEAKSDYYQADAYTSNTSGKYASLSSKAIYLADSGIVWTESKNLDGAESNRNAAWKGAAIYIGGESNADMTDGTRFEKGIGMQPMAPADGGMAWTIIDVSKLGCDTFYAAIGSTNALNQQNGVNKFIYQVFGATEKDGDFTLLAQSEAITKTQTGEFKVDITDMKLLKLVVKCTDGGTHACGNSVWANACVYNLDGSAGNKPSATTTTKKPSQKDAYTSNTTGSYLAPTGTIYYLSELDWIKSANLADIETIRNGTYKNGDAIWLGGESGGKITDGTRFEKGLGVMPFAPSTGNFGDAETVWDVSELNVDTFYGVVGITNANGQNYAYGDAYNDATFAGAGVVFEVYGSTSTKGTSYKLLAQSEAITKTKTGEFKVDISGMKLLKLVVRCNKDIAGAHTSMNSAWGNACVFNSATGSLDASVNGGSTAAPTTPTAPKTTRPDAPASTDEGTGSGTVVIVIVISVILLIALALAIALLLKKKKNRK